MADSSIIAGPIAPHRDVLFQELEGESVLLHLDSGLYFGLDSVGTRVWQLIVEHGDLGVVFRRMLEEFEVPPETLEADLRHLVSKLADRRLVILGSYDAA